MVTQRHHAEDAAMRRALELAARGLGSTSPNPIVGCVVLDRSGEVAGEGWHTYAGGPHAEVVALERAADRARGGTTVVTLEPCAHTGRTGPCAQALIEAGITRVVYAIGDPSPAAAGGAAVLRAAGVEVEAGLLADVAERVNAAWLTSVRLRRPHVTWKFAATLDGRVAAADHTSRWITSAAARSDAHRLRAEVDAVVVGTGTALRDDPALTVRLDEKPRDRQPLRVVVGTRDVPEQARVRDDRAETLFLRTHDPVEVLETLHKRDVVSVLLEGGPTLAAAFVHQGFVDRVVAYVAPALLGDGPAAVAGLGIDTIDDALRLRVDDVVRIGSDIRVTAHMRAPEEA
ncbi:MAG: bifunctional diaminohydroxyphosphoribosylaminopyrimidine deaminase/5-amino-6-(5-phosphoribosylamino)uracil reductase RibD [Candidatus Nanopelagicales bacterium]